MGPVAWAASKIDSDPVILSHHPMCGRFDDHMFKVRGRSVCLGCATVYPSALVTALVLLFIGQVQFWSVFMFALSAFAVNLLRFVAKSHRFSAVFNAALGMSFGAALYATVYAPADLQPALVILVITVASGFSLFKGRRVFAVCKACEHYHRFPSCCRPGFLGHGSGGEGSG